MYYCRVKGSKQPIYVKYRILVGIAKGREIFPSRFLRSILQEWKFWWDKNFVNAFVNRFAEKKEHVKKCRSVIFNLRFSLPIYTYVSTVTPDGPLIESQSVFYCSRTVPNDNRSDLTRLAETKRKEKRKKRLGGTILRQTSNVTIA